jgi:hypothetical protein
MEPPGFQPAASLRLSQRNKARTMGLDVFGNLDVTNRCPVRGLPGQEQSGRESSRLVETAFDQIVMVVGHFVKWSGMRADTWESGTST